MKEGNIMFTTPSVKRFFVTKAIQEILNGQIEATYLLIDNYLDKYQTCVKNNDVQATKLMKGELTILQHRLEELLSYKK